MHLMYDMPCSLNQNLHEDYCGHRHGVGVLHHAMRCGDPVMQPLCMHVYTNR